MNRIVMGFAAMFVVTCISTAAARADQRVASDELPAALQALNIEQSQILNSEQAGAVRGQGGPVWIAGWVTVDNKVAWGSFHFFSTKNELKVVLTPKNFLIKFPSSSKKSKY